jgi:hypothetical protein
MCLAQAFINLDEELNLSGLAAEQYHFMAFVPYIGIQGHQDKRVYYPACVNKILSLISQIMSLQSLIFSLLDKTCARMLFHL